MSILYVHGVKVRSKEHGIELEKPFQRWLGPKLSPASGRAVYEPVYWGDLAARFRWQLASRPPTQLLRMGGDDNFAALGTLREAGASTKLDAGPAPSDQGPVLGRSGADREVAPPLSSIPRERRPDILADLYLLCRPSKKAEDPIADDPQVAALANAAAIAAEKWDQIIADEPSEDARAQRLLAEVQKALNNDDLIGMGGIADWMTGAGEALRRATAWPGDVVGTIFAETRPILNEFIAYFVGDVFTYLTNRGTAESPGEITTRVLEALRRAHANKQKTGEKIVILSHSMGGQLVYDALTCFADHDPGLAGMEVDHWITCGSQVSLFAEMRLFLGQPDLSSPARLPLPKRVKAWTNYFDRNDMVGFVMAPVFDGVADQEYDTGYGLALAHTGFLARPSFFKVIAERV